MQMTYLFLYDHQLVVALLWIMRHFFHVIFWVNNVDFCLYTEFLNSRNQFFVSNSRQCFSVPCLDFRASPHQDLGVRALLGHFQWPYFSCQPPVLGLHAVSPLTAGCRFFAQRSHGFCLFGSHVKLLGLGGRQNSFYLWDWQWANFSSWGTRRAFLCTSGSPRLYGSLP